MDDREFFDELYQMWTRTTFAQTRYWDYHGNDDDGYDIHAVGPGEDDREFVAFTNQDADADFITAIHGCFGDLHRCLHEALDEADRLDLEMDEVQQQLMSAELRVQELEEIVAGLSTDPPWQKHG